MTKTLFTLAVAVLFVAASAQATVVTLEVTKNANPASGLESYTIAAVTDTGVVATLSDINVSGSIAQTGANLYGSMGLTPYIGDFAAPIDPATSPYDSHCVVPATDILSEIGGLVGETNDGNDINGLDPLAGVGFAPSWSGMGTLGTPTNYSMALLPAAQKASVDVFQVVVPAGTAPNVWVLVGVVTLEGDDSFKYPREVQLPEPATMLMLGIGGVGLVLRRRR